ncbi:MAG: hypothetical protein N2712_00460 [Brevinematales bacterium]|nr:hypothetical protein [Brevinematales bacterium]
MYFNKRLVITLILLIIFVSIVVLPTLISGKTFYGIDGNIGIIKEYSEVIWKFNNQNWYHNYLLGFPSGIGFNISIFLGKIIGYERVPIFDVLLYMVVSFLGMFILLRGYGILFWGAVFGATGISLTTMGILSVFGGHLNGSLSFLILALGLTKYLYSRDLSIVKTSILILLIGVSLGIAFVDPQRTIYFGFVYGAYLILLSLSRVSGFSNLPKVDRKLLIKLIIIPAAIFVIFLVFSMNSIVSLFGITQMEQIGVQKDDPETKWRFLVQFSMPPEEILNFLIPGIFGYFSNDPNLPYWGRAAQDFDYEKTRQGMRNFRLGIDNYLAVLFVPFLIMSFLYFGTWDPEKKKHFIFWGIVAVIAFLISIARYFPTLFWLLIQIPFMDKFRVPSKWMDIFVISIVIMSSFSFDSFLRNLKGDINRNKILLNAFLVYSGVLLFVYLILLGFRAEIAFYFASSQQYDYGVAQKISDNISSSVGNAFIFVLLGTLILYLLQILSSRNVEISDVVSSKSLIADVILGIFVIVVFINMVIVTKPIFKEVDPYKLYAKNDIVKFMEEKTKNEQARFVMYSPLANHYFTFLFPYYNLETIQTIAQSRLPEDYVKLLPFISSFNFDVMAKYGTVYFVTELPPTHQVFLQLPIITYYTNLSTQMYLSEDQPSITHSVFVYKITNYLPRFFITPNYIKYNGQIEMVLMLPVDVLKNSVLLTNDIANFISSQNLSYDIKVEEYTKDYSKLKVTTSDKAFLVFNTYYDPKWECYVDGKKKDIMKANFLVQAVLLDTPGEHVVEFKFNAFSVWVMLQMVLLVISILALVILGVWDKLLVKKGKL